MNYNKRSPINQFRPPDLKSQHLSSVKKRALIKRQNKAIQLRDIRLREAEEKLESRSVPADFEEPEYFEEEYEVYLSSQTEFDPCEMYEFFNSQSNSEEFMQIE